MTGYTAPIDEMRFVLDAACDFGALAATDRFAEASSEVVDAILSEAGRMASEIVAPINRAGDQQGCRLENGVVRVPEGFADAYQQYVDAGWNGLSVSGEAGGQGLPFTLALAVQEAFTAANLAWSLCPMLNQGALEALVAHGTEEQKAVYLPKMISGEWTATMNLTEPQAGSDVGALKTRALPNGDGSWRIKGQKIYITWGEHEMAENIVHLVLARTPDAPAGTRGISMFIVPKFLPDEDGKPGRRNDLKCVGLEEKLGIHGSPTCTMSFGDNDDCRGFLIGDECRGMRNMFTMMNHARINVGLQGVAIAERAYQQAVSYARERLQGADAGGNGHEAVPIIRHGDVRRMLMTMRAYTEAARALCYFNAAAVDRAQAADDTDQRSAAQGLADLLTPVSKAFSTDIGVEMTSLGIQIHGGMGYVEETGAAQHFRDARIAPIYEGTNGIQAMDLVGRKLVMDGGAHWRRLISEMRNLTEEQSESGRLTGMAGPLDRAVTALEKSSAHLLDNGMDKFRDTGVAAGPYLRLFGTTVGAWLLVRQAVAAQARLEAGRGNPAFLETKISTAAFFCHQILPAVAGLSDVIVAGAGALYDMDDEAFARH